MRRGGLERKLVWALLLLLLIPTAAIEAALVILYRRGVFADPLAQVLAMVIGLAALALYVGWAAHGIGRELVRTVQTIRDGTELMATVHPEHRIDVRTGDELEALAEDVNRLADHLRDARQSLEARVARATGDLASEREKLAAILGQLADGVVVTALDGRITLANPVAQELLGRGASLLGRRLHEFAERGRLDAECERLLAVGGGARIAFTTESGAVLHGRMTSLVNGEGHAGGFILSLRDSSSAAGALLAEPAAGRSIPAFVGAGTVSGVNADVPAPERSDLYDFQLFEEMEPRVSVASREHRLTDLTYVVLDVETTGLRPEAGDRIVSLAAVRVHGGVVRRAELFDALVCPECAIPPASTRFHGITDAMVAGAPPIAVVLPAFHQWSRGAVLVGPELSFDLAFLARDGERLGLPSLTAEHPVLDTRLLSRLIHGRDADHALEAVARRLGVPIIGRHSALGDALTTAEILARLVELLAKRGFVTLGDTLAGLRRFPRSPR
jgi:DNA polymerase III epsilon subunit-like protein/PAS domain-containing protein